MKPIHNNRSRPRHQGFSLIEVMVALLVLSIGLLGLAALQTTSLQFNTGSYYRTQATFLAYDILDRMRANSIGVKAGSYNATTSAAAAAAKADTTACSTGCNTTDLAKYDLGEWYRRMEIMLPGSTLPTNNYALISRDAANVVTITINWVEKDLTMRQIWVVQL
ncbi:MAG: type IV pilus modification protein PilV [Sulfuricaulis sp.]|uniref:type IV pilus modification protein PilV n=1 Tax=Sulfuricaulis sp. TaxID=2003553 RepID=UPI0025FB9101|nr:type IV pilus modification protein PilV [Sulfuricaulis sp.]MCR4346808.1 type IV pilus modification protein PilV [Sulfuricaulis sp.]